MARSKPRLLSRKELATMTGLSVAYFEKHRADGKAPPITKLGGRVFYDEADVNAWLSSNRQDLGGPSDA